MTAQEFISMLKSASVDEMNQIRNLLLVPDIYHGSYSGEIPKNVGDLWNRQEQRVETPRKSPDTPNS